MEKILSAIEGLLQGTGSARGKREWVMPASGRLSQVTELRAAGAFFGESGPDLVLDRIGDIETVERPQKKEPGHLLTLGPREIGIDGGLSLGGIEKRPDCLLTCGGGKIPRNHTLYAVHCTHENLLKEYEYWG